MITEINRTACEVIRREVDAALQEVGKRHGIAIRTLRGTFSPTSFTFKVEAAVMNGGVAETKEVRDFRQMATLYGLKESDLNREVMLLGENHMITGCSPRSLGYPILAKNMRTGKVFKFTSTTIQKAFLILLNPS